MKWMCKRYTGVFAPILIAVLLSGCASVNGFFKETYVVHNGRPRAAIVIAPDGERPRMATLAALELQRYVEKISGARLPITNAPAENVDVNIFVGASEYTRRRGVTAKGLTYGAYRMVSGSDWLVLLGSDFDYVPTEPWARNSGDRPRAQADWDKITMDAAGSKWKVPFLSTYEAKWNWEYQQFMTARYGAENRPLFTFEETWKQTPWRGDRGGTLNAVSGFLRTLGVRWYMPGPLGEVVPECATIPLPQLDQVVRPDYAIREWCFPNFAATPLEQILWYHHLGMNTSGEALGFIGVQHGLHMIHSHPDMRRDHPEYYAWYRGERVTDYRNMGHVCFSHPDIFNETVKFARFIFDRYDQPHVSLWPVDGFKQCECPECSKCSASELVWGFVDRVARELYKTHPDRMVSCGAYSPYIHPPDTIEKFPPNVYVVMANCGRPLFDDPMVWDSYWERVEGWRSKLAPGHLVRVENNLSGLGRKFPVIHPRMMAKDLRALKGLSLGDVCEEAFERSQFHSPGYDHLTLYVQSRFLWDADQDIDVLLDDYYAKFYGSAAAEMKAAIEFAESAYSRTDGSRSGGRCDPRNATLPDRIRFGELLRAARTRAGDTVPGQRIQVIMDEFESYATLDELRRQWAEQQAAGDPRADAPVVEAGLVSRADTAKSYPLRLHLGRTPDAPTEFTVAWERDEVLFNVRCEEPDMSSIRTPENVWDGDSVIVLLESPSHSYYHIEISPDGRVYDADHMGGGRIIPQWDSVVDADTERGSNYWHVTARIPIALVGVEGAEGDPMNYVIGPPLAPGSVWYFNLGRRRPREGQKTAETEQVFAATGAWSIFRSGDSADASRSFAKLVME